jgi:hypothetical protein
MEFADRRGWRELTNGDLLNAAEREGFDVLLTADTNFGNSRTLLRAGSLLWRSRRTLGR